MCTWQCYSFYKCNILFEKCIQNPISNKESSILWFLYDTYIKMTTSLKIFINSISHNKYNKTMALYVLRTQYL